MAKARLIRAEFKRYPDGSYADLTIWRVPEPVRGSDHEYKYRLDLVVDGTCVLRYDNEAGKEITSMSERTNTLTASGTSTGCVPISLWRPEDGSFGTVVIRVQTFEQTLKEKIADGPIASIDFATYEILHKALTPARVQILRAMAGAGPLSIREVARRVGRDFKGAHTDVTSLFKDGLLKKTAAGQMIFPFEGIRFEFDLLPLPEAVAAAAE
jgi:predicted transcriptional regulator